MQFPSDNGTHRPDEASAPGRPGAPDPTTTPATALAGLGEATLCGGRWDYGAADDTPRWGALRFAAFCLPWDTGNPRGRVLEYGHPNEQFWELAEHGLLLMNGEGRVTTLFDRVESADGRPALLGRHRLPGGGLHRLQLRPPEPRPDNAPLAIHAEPGADPRTLLVSFNSLANPAPVCGPFRREYARTAGSAGTDTLCLAEGVGEAAWFLRDRALVERTLAEHCAGRHRVVLIGNSSGGYAALRFGEWLHQLRLAPDVRTVSVNPQTVHTAPHRRFLLGRDWTALLPAMIDQTVLAEAAPLSADLPVLFRRSGPARLQRRRHLVFFDRDNPVECFHSGQLAAFRQVTLRGVPVGRTHAYGIHEIERSGIVRAALGRAIGSRSRWWRA